MGPTNVFAYYRPIKRSSFAKAWYLDLQSTQNSGPCTQCFGIKAIVLGALKVQVPAGLLQRERGWPADVGSGRDGRVGASVGSPIVSLEKS